MSDTAKELRSFKIFLSSFLYGIFQQHRTDAIPRAGYNWEHLKKIIGQKTLLPQARKWVGSRYRKKNHFACRCFTLSSQPQDEEKIKALLNYPHISVHIQALFSAVSFMESNGCSDQLLKIIFKRLEENISRWLFAYKAVLIRGKSFIAPWIEKELEREKQPLLRTIYLDLLSLMIGDRVLTYLVDDLKSDNRNLRLTALKIVSQFPKPVDAATLIKLYSDPDPEIRRFVLQTLPSVMGEKAIHLLQESLQDSSWEICLQSALGLKSFGQTGKKILESQEKESDSFAYEASQFVLALPSEVNYVNF